MKKTYLNRNEISGIKSFKYEIIDDLAIVLIRFLDVSKIYKNNKCIVDKGYYWLEIMDKNNICLTAIYNEDKVLIEYYFDITKNNNFIDLSFDDLYIDVVMDRFGNLRVLDIDELNMALKNNTINNDDYDIAINTKDSLIEELNNNLNKLNIFCDNYLNNNS